MNLLAIETATESCSVALLAGGQVLTRSLLAPRRHAELVLPMCEELLAEAGLSRRSLGAIAVGRGPGAFTGVRLAISMAQGLALALDIPIIPISSLAALAYEAPDNDAATLAVIDARMGEIYAGVFRRTADGLVELMGTETVGLADALMVPAACAWNVIGSGWNVYRETITRCLSGVATSEAGSTEGVHWADGDKYPQAASVAHLALPIAEAGNGVAPELALPIYLRDKVALTLNEQRPR